MIACTGDGEEQGSEERIVKCYRTIIFGNGIILYIVIKKIRPRIIYQLDVWGFVFGKKQIFKTKTMINNIK